MRSLLCGFRAKVSSRAAWRRHRESAIARQRRRSMHRLLFEPLEPRLLLSVTNEIEPNDTLELATGWNATEDPAVSSPDWAWARSVPAAMWTTGGSTPRRATG
jgi:hypothetical protein